MALALQNFLTAAGVTGQYAFRSVNVGYSADNVTDLVPSAAELALFTTDPVAAYLAYNQDNVAPYLSSISQGISDTVSYARLVHQQCPHSLLILAGYSQGAMVMHQAERQLYDAGDNGLLGQIAGTLLLGDGDRVPNTQAKEFGTSSAKSEGVRTWAKQNDGQDVEAPATTANICNTRDIVCATSLKVLAETVATGSGVRVHTHYVTANSKTGKYSHVDPALTSAADWIGQLAAARILSSQWTAASAPLPADAAANPYVYISSISCYTASWCAGVGTYRNTSGETAGLLLTKSGTAWSAATAPLPPGSGTASADLYAVACPSASSCVAVGDYQYSSGTDGGLIETWSGSGWSAATAPLPPPDYPGDQSQGGSLTSMACPSALVCVADGTYVEYDPSTGEGSGQGMVLADSGGTWTVAQAPVPPGGRAGSASFGSLSAESVACPSAAWCTAVGSYYDSTADTSAGLLLTWSGGAWTATRAPAPRGSTDVEPSGVACAAVSSCTAIGTYSDSAGNSVGLIDADTGSAWTVGKANTALSFSVACPSASTCVIGADGEVYTGSGTTWQATTAPLAAGGDLLASVACPAAGSCGIAAQSTDSYELQIMVGAPASWTAFNVTPPAPITSVSYLNAIACPTAATCIAAGTFNNGQGAIATGPS
jgi:Cutinase